MTTERLSKFNERFHEIDGSLRKKVCDTIRDYQNTNDEKVLENLNFSLGSDYYHKMADLCFEIINSLKVELTVQLPDEE